MSLLKKLQNKLANEKKKEKNDTEQDAKVWIENVLGPYLLEFGHLGKVKISTKNTDFRNIDNDIYKDAIKAEGITILKEGHNLFYNYLVLSWDTTIDNNTNNSTTPIHSDPVIEL